jgi:hypothetical protein
MSDADEIHGVVLDYIEGWFDGDASRVERALHPELVKRCCGIEGDDPNALETLSAGDLVDATEKGIGPREDADDRRIEIEITNLSDGVASVTCLSHRYVDLLHLIQMPEGWRIVNAAWCRR